MLLTFSQTMNKRSCNYAICGRDRRWLVSRFAQLKWNCLCGLMFVRLTIEHTRLFCGMALMNC